MEELANFNKQIQHLSAYMEEVHLKLDETLKENERLKQEIVHLRLQLDEEPIKSVDWNNDKQVLQKLPIDLEPDSLKSFLNSLIQTEKEQSTLQILVILLHYIQTQESAMAGICISVLSFSQYLYSRTNNEEEKLIEILNTILLDQNLAKSEGALWHSLAFKLLYRLKDKGFNVVITDYLIANSEIVYQNTIYFNDLECLFEYTKLSFIYERFEDVAKIVEHICDHAPIFVLDKQPNLFYRLFWYAFTVGLEQKVLDHNIESSKKLTTTEPEAQLYRILNSIEADPKFYTSKTEEYIEIWKSRVTAFNVFEKEVLFRIYDEKIQKILSINQTREILYKEGLPTFHIITQTKNSKTHCPKCQVILDKREVNLALYKKQSNEIQGYTIIRIPMCLTCNNLYLSGSEIPELRHSLKPNYFKTILDQGDYPPKLKAILKEQIIPKKPLATSAFIWPSTEASESTGGSHQNESNFKEETPLYKLGYKITNLSRQKRWDILERKAIPQMTLKEIVYTIATNIKLRKAQVGGREKFSYAISEWEYDLKKLKETYYKRNFTWPTY